MKAAVLAVLLPAAVAAHDVFGHHVARQASPPPPSGASVSIATATASFSLLSQNPTATPLSDIVYNAPSAATTPMTTTYSPGAVPTAVSGAPGLPDISTMIPTNYPALDLPPPIDTPEVQQWIQDVANSGVVIPNIAVNNAGGCPNNTAAASNTSNCWWSCTGCTRDTDVSTCPDKLTWGLTYDDGPSPYSMSLLEYLDQVNLKTTFFNVGSRVISWPGLLQEEYMAGHQVAVHTWSHTALTTQTNEEIIAELGWTKKVIKDAVGVTPTMMRPPYGDIDDRVRAICTAMDLTPVMWTRISPTATFDTGDFDIHGGLDTVTEVLSNWEDIIGNASVIDTGFIVLEHDLFQQTVEVATGYILPDAIAHNFSIMPVIQCLNKPNSDAYLETNNNNTNPPVASGGSPTLSSGAPGSAQVTGGSSNSSGTSSSGSNSALSLEIGFGLTAIVGGLVAVAGAMLL